MSEALTEVAASKNRPLQPQPSFRISASLAKPANRKRVRTKKKRSEKYLVNNYIDFKSTELSLEDVITSQQFPSIPNLVGEYIEVRNPSIICQVCNLTPGTLVELIRTLFRGCRADPDSRCGSGSTSDVDMY
jgi:hypothetical protein